MVKDAYHVTGAVDLDEGEVAGRLDFSILLTIGLEGGELGALERLVAGPLEFVGPGLIAEPVTDEVGVTSVDEHGNLLKNSGHKKVERLHPVAIEQEISVNVEVAAVVAIDCLNAKGLHDVFLVQIFVDRGKTGIAETTSFAVYANIVWITARLLVGADHLIVAVNGGWHTAEPALTLVAASNHGLTSGQGVVHALALALAENSIVATVTAGHGAVVRILGVRIGQAVADENRLQVDVAILVRQNLGREHRDVVTSIRLAGDVEVLLGILRELLEKQGQQGVDILASSTSIADCVAAVGVADVDWLVKENDGGIAVPRAWVIL